MVRVGQVVDSRKCPQKWHKRVCVCVCVLLVGTSICLNQGGQTFMIVWHIQKNRSDVLPKRRALQQCYQDVLKTWIRVFAKECWSTNFHWALCNIRKIRSYLTAAQLWPSLCTYMHSKTSAADPKCGSMSRHQPCGTRVKQHLTNEQIFCELCIWCVCFSKRY